MISKIILVLLSLWWGWTALIDFVIVPTVFSVINDFFNAGELGIALFFKLNYLEVVLSSMLIVVSILDLRKKGKGRGQFVLACLAWLIVMFYFSFLTPKISKLTVLWKEAELMQKITIAGIKDIQQEHQFYHRVYVGLDTFKLLILSLMLGCRLFRKEIPLAKT